MHWAYYGEDNTYRANLIGPSKSLRRRRLRTFRDNKAHSNEWHGFRFHHFEQFFEFRNSVGVPVFENSWSYRNTQHGIYAYSKFIICGQSDLTEISNTNVFLVPFFL